MIYKYRVCHVAELIQTFERRGSVVKDNEKKRWKQLSYLYMTEESDDPDDSSVIVHHKLPWRSESKLILYSKQEC